MLRLLPAGGIACVCLLVDQQKQMSTRVNIPVARRGNVVVSLLRLGVQLILPESSGFLLVLVVVQRYFIQGCEGERRYRTLISLLGSLATMSRVVNYHSSWARQQQVELFDASGNPGFTAGRGFNPAGGAPGGG
ncbi:hypothetical protein F511_10391 [Dorcoceras hygrometricum]|uniref:Uncharacterized protein n=1 Tax=Dorcoceras hygrometricum TaxID=472368 RepID=A0A2Z7CBA2_9LAMI|nr:hypothetical protein F511_10391 [Dorcoceras hygrometricum]